ncbi:hypothetical protein BU197_02715 [Streptomyces sp. CBMA291]|nr:hypothetical protein [Streptomyces sp. CBMA291]MBD0715187.1 hypothetical protein [Streptomyces sp. CBMA370]
MPMHEFIAYDPGPGFIAMAGRVGERVVCIATPKVHTDLTARRQARELMKRQGEDCDACQQVSCPLRQAV